MKKIIAIFLSLTFLSIQAVKAEGFGIGISGAVHMLDVSGTETTRQSSEKNSGSHDEEAIVPEIFVETFMDGGVALGIAYIPTREMGSKSRSDTNSEGDTGTYKAEAELDNVIQIYADIPVGSFGGRDVYGKVGIQHATISTLESLNSGSTYPDEDVLGLTLGLGTKGDLAANAYYKAELTYTNFEDYSAESSSTIPNKVDADLEDIAARFSIGYKF